MRLCHFTGVPGPEKLTVDSVMATSAVVSWNPPEGIDGTLHNFVVSYYNEGTELQTITTDSYSNDITGLKPDTEYIISVCTEVQGGHRSEPASTTFYTGKLK